MFMCIHMFIIIIGIGCLPDSLSKVCMCCLNHNMCAACGICVQRTKTTICICIYIYIYMYKEIPQSYILLNEGIGR